jgi:hypothetical protein
MSIVLRHMLKFQSHLATELKASCTAENLKGKNPWRHQKKRE